ncbi:MAG: hypothetical protein B6D39_03760 [Anaerolineae bacterium UTCFX2]|jgi:hypothetical protein|nr:hypothetical protein [Anaerolineae bacterium]MCZ7552135.1 hypothetical protein [Anaerolineales bacterium]OQY93010.1 MAG: hypothetical protein B6D39_03760 [Anaerolineae bacterium UTCFX2]
MNQQQTASLAAVFAAVQAALEKHRQQLNQEDVINGNHGDHMVEVFLLASQAAASVSESDPGGAMIAAAQALENCSNNGSAEAYARGLRQMGEQLRRGGVTLNELAAVLEKALAPDEGKIDPENSTGQKVRDQGGGAALKALLAGLAGWNQAAAGRAVAKDPLDLGAMFEFGTTLLQAKQRQGKRIDVLADAAVSASPLKAVPHRQKSGMIAMRTLLEAFQQSARPD